MWRNIVVEAVWPSRTVPGASRARRMGVMQGLLALAITLAWGPEVFAAIEMTTLLELLGASLFLTAYSAGVKLTALEFLKLLQGIVSPLGQLAILRSRAAAGTKALAATSVLINAAGCACAVLVLAAFGSHLFGS